MLFCGLNSRMVSPLWARPSGNSVHYCPCLPPNDRGFCLWSRRRVDELSGDYFCGGIFFSGVVHRYSFRVMSSSADVTLITLSGTMPGMGKACETIREPGFIFSSCGISFSFMDGPRYRVTT